MVTGLAMRSWRYVNTATHTECQVCLEADGQVGFRLKRKETSDLFDSEDMQAAFINVSCRHQNYSLSIADLKGVPIASSDTFATLGIRL
jgi:hypothetical protein